MFALTIISTVIVMGVEDKRTELNPCAYCEKKIWEEGWQMWDIWLHDGCLKELNKEAELIFGNEMNGDRFNYVYERALMGKDK